MHIILRQRSKRIRNTVEKNDLKARTTTCRVIIIFAISQFGRCVVHTSFTFCNFNSRTMHVYTWMHFTIFKYFWQISITTFFSFDAHISRRWSIKILLIDARDNVYFLLLNASDEIDGLILFKKNTMINTDFVYIL